MMTRACPHGAISVCAAIMSAAHALAATDYSGGIHLEAFDALPTADGQAALDDWADDATLPGWYRRGTSDGTAAGDAAVLRFRVDDGSSAGGALYSYGAFGSSERALGFVCSSNAVAMSVGLRLVNRTGAAIEGFVLDYVGEQWRAGEAGASSAAFSYGIGNAGLLEGTWTGVSALDFAALQVGAPFPGAALDGNAAANRVAIGATVLGVDWQPGESLWLRWSGVNQPGRDHGFAIDGLSFVAVPGPAGIALLGLAGLRGRPAAARRR